MVLAGPTSPQSSVVRSLALSHSPSIGGPGLAQIAAEGLTRLRSYRWRECCGPYASRGSCWLISSDGHIA